MALPLFVRFLSALLGLGAGVQGGATHATDGRGRFGGFFFLRGQADDALVVEDDQRDDDCPQCGEDKRRPPPRTDEVHHGADHGAGGHPEQERPAEGFAIGQLGLGRGHGGEAGDGEHIEGDEGDESRLGGARGLDHGLHGRDAAVHLHVDGRARYAGRQRAEGSDDVLLGDEARDRSD